MRRTRWVFFQGHTCRLSEAIRLSGIKPSTVEERLRRGWSTRKALETPTGGGSIAPPRRVRDEVADLREAVKALRREMADLRAAMTPATQEARRG